MSLREIELSVYCFKNAFIYNAFDYITILVHYNPDAEGRRPRYLYFTVSQHTVRKSGTISFI